MDSDLKVTSSQTRAASGCRRSSLFGIDQRRRSMVAVNDVPAVTLGPVDRTTGQQGGRAGEGGRRGALVGGRGRQHRRAIGRHRHTWIRPLSEVASTLPASPVVPVVVNVVEVDVVGAPRMVCEPPLVALSRVTAPAEVERTIDHVCRRSRVGPIDQAAGPQDCAEPVTAVSSSMPLLVVAAVSVAEAVGGHSHALDQAGVGRSRLRRRRHHR